jgi:hypothetical protein
VSVTLYENVRPISLLAGADFSMPTFGSAGGQYRFGIINPNAVSGLTNPDNPGQGFDGATPYGGATTTISVKAGNVVVAGANAPNVVVIAGKALPGQPIECHAKGTGGTLVIAGGAIAAGAEVSVGANGVAVTQSGSDPVVGVARTPTVEGAGDLISVLLV